MDPNERNRVFDLVLSMTTLDKEQNLNLHEIQLEADDIQEDYEEEDRGEEEYLYQSLSHLSHNNYDML